MLELRTFGGLELRRAEGDGDGVVVLQTKRLALLAYLAAAPAGQFRRRDAILALFWPDLDQQHAQGSLRQAIYSLRKSLGDGVVVTRTDDEIGLDASLIGSDARRLDSALQSGEPGVAIECYRGDFLDGVFVADAAPELEEWVAGERARLRSLGARAAWAAADATTDRAMTGSLVRRAVFLSGYDEPALRRGMALLDGWGDRAGALALHRETAERFRRDLDARLSDESEAMAAVIRERRSEASGAPPPKDSAPIEPPPPASASAAGGPGPVPTLIPNSRRRVLRGVVAAILVVALGAAGAMGRIGSRSEVTASPRRDLVAVVPFEVAAGDSSLEWLREGVVELLATRLAGADGSGAVDPRASINAWSTSGGAGRAGGPSAPALAALGRLGAGRVVTGSVVRSGADVVIAAALLRVPDGQRLGQAEVHGATDSTVRLVDSLAIRLLAEQAGEDPSRLNTFKSSPLPAVQAYLAGRVALRRGHPRDAVDRFQEALTYDSSLAPAALGLRAATGRLDGVLAAHAESLALANLNRLDPRERRLFLTELGPRYPAWYPPADRLRDWRGVVASDWTLGEAWNQLGLVYREYGSQLGVSDPIGEAGMAFERAMDLNPGDAAEARPDLYDIAATRGDTALFRRALQVGQDYADDESLGSPTWRAWLAAFVARDTVRLHAMDQELGQLTTPELRSIPRLAQRAGFGIPYAVAALDQLDQRARSLEDRDVAARHRYTLALNRGRPLEAQRVADRMHSEWTPLSRLAIQLRSALVGDGDEAAGVSAAAALAAETAGPLADDPAARRAQLIHACAGEHWRLAHGDTHLTQRALTMLREAEPAAVGPIGSFYATCSATLEAWRAELERRPDRRLLVERLDSMVSRGQAYYWAVSLHRALAGLWEREGDPPRALRAVRGRSYSDAVDLAADLREEGRLAAIVGDSAGAIRAWRHFLILRADPEPSLRAQRDSVALALASLERPRRR